MSDIAAPTASRPDGAENVSAPAASSNSPILWTAICLVFVGSRILWNMLYPSEISGDCLQYFHLATSLRREGLFGVGGEPNIFWPPLWPALLSLTNLHTPILGLTGPVWLPWAVGGLALLALVRFAIWACGGDHRPAQVMALLYCFNPSHLLLSNIPATEHLFLLLTALFLWLGAAGLGWLEGKDRPRASFMIVTAVLVGLCLSLATLTRPVTLPLYGAILMAALALVLFGRRRHALFFGIVFLAAILPVWYWTHRNYLVSGHVVVVATNGPDNLYLGANPHVEPYWREPMTEEERRIQKLPPALGAAELKSRALEYIKSHPFAWLGKGMRKIEFYFGIEPSLSLRWEWYGEVDKNAYNVIRGLNGVVLYATLILMTVCVVLWWVVPVAGGLTRFGLWLCLGVSAYFLAIAFITWGMPRYRYPAEPFMWLIAISGAIRAVRARRQGRRV